MTRKFESDSFISDNLSDVLYSTWFFVIDTMAIVATTITFPVYMYKVSYLIIASKIIYVLCVYRSQAVNKSLVKIRGIRPAFVMILNLTEII